MTNYFSAITSIGVGIVTTYSLIVPTAGNRPVTSFRFPDRISLNSWQQLNSFALITTEEKTLEDREDVLEYLELENQEIVQSSQGYGYTKDNINLEVEMRYVVGTAGRVNAYIQKYTDIPLKDLRAQKIEQIKDIGYHILFTNGDRAYLISCIAFNGSGSVTAAQFAQYFREHNSQSQVWLDWLKGKASLRDRRCLWTQLSIPVDRAEPQLTYKTLENFWVDWHQWWKPRFPSL